MITVMPSSRYLNSILCLEEQIENTSKDHTDDHGNEMVPGTVTLALYSSTGTGSEGYLSQKSCS